MSILRTILVAMVALAAAGCAQKLGSHQVSLQAIEILKQDAIPAMGVGQFVLAPGHSPSLDKSVGIRSVSLTSPDNDSFSQYLGKTLETDLRSAGKLNPNSDFVVQGAMTASDVSAGLSEGTAILGARFSLLRRGTPIFEKELTVRSQWDSSFVGAIAIPAAINQYTALYDKLVLQLLEDKDFRLALTPSVSLNAP